MFEFDPRLKLTWEEFHALPVKARAASFSRKGKLYHAIFTQQFDRKLLEDLSELATAIRKIAKTRAGMDFLRSILPHKRAMLYFQQIGRAHV